MKLLSCLLETKLKSNWHQTWGNTKKYPHKKSYSVHILALKNKLIYCTVHTSENKEIRN